MRPLDVMAQAILMTHHSTGSFTDGGRVEGLLDRPWAVSTSVVLPYVTTRHQKVSCGDLYFCRVANHLCSQSKA